MYCKHQHTAYKLSIHGSISILQKMTPMFRAVDSNSENSSFQESFLLPHFAAHEIYFYGLMLSWTRTWLMFESSQLWLGTSLNRTYLVQCAPCCLKRWCHPLLTPSFHFGIWNITVDTPLLYIHGDQITISYQTNRSPDLSRAASLSSRIKRLCNERCWEEQLQACGSTAQWAGEMKTTRGAQLSSTHSQTSEGTGRNIWTYLCFRTNVTNHKSVRSTGKSSIG